MEKLEVHPFYKMPIKYQALYLIWPAGFIIYATYLLYRWAKTKQ